MTDDQGDQWVQNLSDIELVDAFVQTGDTWVFKELKAEQQRRANKRADR